MEQISVERAANHLGVSRMQIGRLIQRGDLDADRFGRAWMINRDSLQRYAAARPGRGRPLSAPAAWRQIMEAEPRSLAELRRLANACRRRSVRHRVQVLPGELDGALGDRRLVVGGAGSAIDHGAAVGQPREHVAYIRSSDLAGFLPDHFGSSNNASPNLVLCVVGDRDWPFVEQRFVPRVVAAVDLVDVGDVRSASEVIRSARWI